MPTIISHSIAAFAIGKIFAFQRMPARFWILAALCSMLPDVDVVSFAFGISYGDMLGHRGLTHSLAFALVLGFAVAWFISLTTPTLRRAWPLMVIIFFAVTASHGLLDAMTNGGLGIAFFAPFSNTRYFFPWRPIQVSPIGIDAFFSSPIPVLWSEIKWIWLPSGVLILLRKLIDDFFHRATNRHAQSHEGKTPQPRH
jgi:inner membrane protein